MTTTSAAHAVATATLTTPLTRVSVDARAGGAARAVARADVVAREEPLEIRVEHGESGARVVTSLAVTMRTPGDDEELAVGLLVHEGIAGRASDVARVSSGETNVAHVELAPGVAFELGGRARHFVVSSACGACGKTSLAALGDEAARAMRFRDDDGGVDDARVIADLPRALGEAQAVFACTGGLHAAALFDLQGALLLLREDVGRHNALDKLTGARLRGASVPQRSTPHSTPDAARRGEVVLVVSGRASFELVQKAIVARHPVLVAIGAPSSLAVELASDANMTLVGFAREGGFNVYAGAHRVRVEGGGGAP